MGISQYDPTAKGRPAWNAGRQVGAKRALKVRQIWAVRFFLDRKGRMRDRAQFDLAIDSKLRGCDLVKIKVGTLVTGREIRARFMVTQQKTGRPVQFEITADARASLLAWLERRGGTVDDFAFPSRLDASDVAGASAGMSGFLGAAGGELTDIVQVQIFLVDGADAPGMNRVYARFFDTRPYPVRATVVVKELLAKGLRIKITATAVLG